VTALACLLAVFGGSLRQEIPVSRTCFAGIIYDEAREGAWSQASDAVDLVAWR